MGICSKDASKSDEEERDAADFAPRHRERHEHGRVNHKGQREVGQRLMRSLGDPGIE